MSRSLLLFVLLAVACLLGCQRDTVAPPLVNISDVTPRELELGDRLEVLGAGFPQGRSAHVSFVGDVHRAGERPVRAATIDGEGVVTAPDRLEIPIDERLLERFCGRGDQAAHATFRGDIELSFASVTPGALPLVGRRRDVVLDLRPSSVGTSLTLARAAEGARVLAYLGIAPGPITSRGLPIERVERSSPADHAGIEVGDVLVAVDGVNVREVADVVPISARTTELTIRHGETANDETKTLSMLGYAGERIPTELAPALVVVALALAALLLLVMPGPASLALLELRMASRLRRKRLVDLARALFGSRKHAALSALASSIICAVALLCPTSSTPSDLDGVALFSIAAALLVASRVSAHSGFVASLRAMLDTGTATLVMGGALAVLVAHLGSVSLAEIARTQGGAPWEFAAARHPGAALVAIVYTSALVGVLRVRGTPLVERAAVLLAAALGTIVFFGGWQLPGVEGPPRTTGALLGGGLLLVLKTWLYAALVWAAARGAFAPWTGADVRRLAVRRLVPGVLLAAALVLSSRRLVPSSALETACGATSAALLTLLVIRSAARVRSALLRPEPHASPFL